LRAGKYRTAFPECHPSGPYRPDEEEGQQLLDLKKAYDAGAISRDEYDRLRKKIVQGE